MIRFVGFVLIALLAQDAMAARRQLFFSNHFVPVSVNTEVNSPESMQATYAGGPVERIAVAAATSAANALSERIESKLDKLLSDGIVITTRSMRTSEEAPVLPPEKPQVKVETPDGFKTQEAQVEDDDDVITYTECDDNRCYGVFTAKRSIFKMLRPMFGRHFVVREVHKSKSVLANGTVQKSKIVTANCTCANCQCDPCQCGIVIPKYSTITYAENYPATTFYGKTVAVKRFGFFRFFGRWRCR